MMEGHNFLLSSECSKHVKPLLIDGLFEDARPFYKYVPKEIKKNLIFRRELLKAGFSKADYAQQIWDMCSRDILFALNSFAWTYNPKQRKYKGIKILPFISYIEFQDYAILKLQDAIENGYDIGIEKSREMGVSWLNVYVLWWFWQFREFESELMVSRTKEYVDKAGNPKALFQKLDFLYKFLPIFLKPPIIRHQMHLLNLWNGSVINGEATTSNIARGDRLKVIFADEVAAFKISEGFEFFRSTRDATNCRIVNSTYKGTNDGYYAFMQLEQTQKLKLLWYLHPEKNRGLYIGHADGRIEILDKNYKFPSNYDFKRDGKIRSPWYDNECGRCVDSKEIASELDCNPEGSGDKFFDQSWLENFYIPKYCRDPLAIGEIVVDDEDLMTGHFERMGNGKLEIWYILSEMMKVNELEVFGIGADIAAGTGASNSVLSVWNLMTGEKVAQWIDSNTSPEKLSGIAVALAVFFNNAMLKWEANGAGQIFGKKVIDFYKYNNIYYRINDTSITRKVTDTPGWWNIGDAKTILIGEYRGDLTHEKIVNRSLRAVKETFQYIYTPNGVEHQKTISPDSGDSGSKKHHGDIVIADSLGSSMCKSADKKEEEKNYEEDPPVGSFAYRRKKYEEKMNSKEDD